MPKKHPEGSGFDFKFFRAQDSRIPDLQHPCLALTKAYAGGPLRQPASPARRARWACLAGKAGSKTNINCLNDSFGENFLLFGITINDFPLLFLSSHHNHKLTFYNVGGEMGDDFLQSASHRFFVNLGQFA